MDVKEYPIGTEVYYSWEDYDTGEPIVYKGTIKSITTTDMKLGDTVIPMKFYMLDNGIGVQHNSCYTIQELFQLKEHLESIYETTLKQELLKKVGTNG